MGQGCSADQQPNGGHVERKVKNMGSPVFIGQMANAAGGGQNSAPQPHCPGAPSTLPTPPCGGRTDNCEAKGEAVKVADKAETVTCNVTEYELTCKWEPRVVPKTCTVMVPQYKAVCSGQNVVSPPKKLQATVQRTYQVDTRFDANNDGIIQQAEFEAAQRGGGLSPMGNPTIVGGNRAELRAAGGGGMAMGGGAMSGAAMGQMGGGAQMGGAAQMGGGMGGGYGGQMGGGQMSAMGGGGYGN